VKGAVKDGMNSEADRQGPVRTWGRIGRSRGFGLIFGHGRKGDNSCANHVGIGQQAGFHRLQHGKELSRCRYCVERENGESGNSVSCVSSLVSRFLSTFRHGVFLLSVSAA
jgi:hypothetical protein